MLYDANAAKNSFHIVTSDVPIITVAETMHSFTRASRTLARMAWCEQRLTAAAVRPLHVSVSAAAEAMPLPSVEKVVERVGLLNRRF